MAILRILPQQNYHQIEALQLPTVTSCQRLRERPAYTYTRSDSVRRESAAVFSRTVYPQPTTSSLQKDWTIEGNTPMNGRRNEVMELNQAKSQTPCNSRRCYPQAGLKNVWRQTSDLLIKRSGWHPAILHTCTGGLERRQQAGCLAYVKRYNKTLLKSAVS